MLPLETGIHLIQDSCVNKWGVKSPNCQASIDLKIFNFSNVQLCNVLRAAMALTLFPHTSLKRTRDVFVCDLSDCKFCQSGQDVRDLARLPPLW